MKKTILLLAVCMVLLGVGFFLSGCAKINNETETAVTFFDLGIKNPSNHQFLIGARV